MSGASSFDALFEEANDLASQRSFRLAAAKYREAIQLEPRRPVAHFNLGCALERSGETETAAMSFHAAMQRYPEDSSPWAESAAASFNCLTQDSAPTPRATPSWFMSDEALKRLSSRVVAATSDDPLTKRARLQAITMRAAVLASDATGFKPPWPTGPRHIATALTNRHNHTLSFPLAALAHRTAHSGRASRGGGAISRGRRGCWWRLRSSKELGGASGSLLGRIERAPPPVCGKQGGRVQVEGRPDEAAQQ